MMFAPPLHKAPGKAPHTLAGQAQSRGLSHADRASVIGGADRLSRADRGWNFIDLPLSRRDRPGPPASLQAKLVLGGINDPLEREADRAADHVMRMPVGEAPRLSRKCADCEEDDRKLQTKRSDASATGDAPSIVHEVLNTAGHPLDWREREFFEPRFGQDFSAVRIHTDPLAAASARGINARAYTAGSQIVFDTGEYRADRPDGRLLLAHELAHVVQQSDPRTPASIRRKPGDPAPGAQAGFGVVRMRDGSLAIFDAWRDSDNLRAFENRCEVKYLHWRFGAIPIAVEARLLGIFADARSTTFPHGELTSGQQYVLKIDHVLEVQLITAAAQPNTQQVPAGAPAPADQPDVVGEKRGEEKKAGGQGKASPDAETPTAIVASLDYLKNVDPAFSNGYLAMMENFAGLKVTAEMRTMARDRLDAHEIAAIMGGEPVLVDMTRRYLQAVIEFTAWRGDQYSDFSRLVETLLEQVTRGNPTAASNNLAIGRPRRGNTWGIFHRPDWVMYYDAFGQPLRSVAGGAFMDPGYAGAEKISHGINVANIQDPALRGFLNMMRQSVGEPTRMLLVDASQHLLENIEIVKAEVLNNLDEEVKKKFVDMLPVFIGFIGGKAAATFLERSPTPMTAAIGLTLHGLLEIAGYVLQIDFAAQTIQNLMDAGYHISRLRQKDDGTLTEVSQHHLAEGGAYLRKIAADVALLAGTAAFSALLGAIRNVRRVEIECTNCKINFEGRESETGAEMEKRLLKADEALNSGQTLERFSLREPIRKGERSNTLNRIAAELRQRVELLAKQGKGAQLGAKVNAPSASALLEGDALSFILKDQPLAREWLRLSLIKAARENPSIRRSAEFQRLPQEYKALLDQAPDAVRQIMEEIGSFERGSIGRKRVDVADFKLDTGEATVSDPTQASTPWHRFKTLFYARVIKELTGFKVDAMDISGNPLAVPKVMLDQP